MSYVVQLDGKTVQTIEAQTDREGETNLVFRLPNDLKTSDGLINIFNLDLKADISGKYKGVASSAYLYYGSEHKNWQSGVEVLVKDK